MSTPLHRELVTAPGATPARWLLLTHGMYGSGSNWRSIARKIVERRGDWGVALVDLRGHGRSPHGEPPQTLDACAADLAGTIAALAAEERAVAAVAGHSFGGKVALTLRANAPASSAETWLLDSSPSAQPGAWDRPGNDIREVWEMMRGLPARWARRDEFIAAVVARGHRPEFAGWLGMSLAPDGDGVRLIFDLDQICALIGDYYARDLWATLDDRSRGSVRVVIAERSTTVSHNDRSRLEALETATGRVHPHVIAGAGHWLHIDAPAAVVELFATHLP
ncbi:MAG: alpha/beta hydrolase [Deltaproteobacteria bacterium]|nr:alpha/beta hydrolase [Deltaproteobacteria bacterium]